MIRVSEVTARVEGRVSALQGRLGNALQFAALVDRDQAPTVTPAGFVLLGPIIGSAADAVVGLFRQSIRETVSIVLFDRHAGDPTGAKIIDQLTPLVRAIVDAVAGWGPDDCPGVFALDRVEPVGVLQGAMLIQLDFSLDDQLRIAA